MPNLEELIAMRNEAIKQQEQYLEEIEKYIKEFSITYSDRNGITLLVIAFLVSPVGIPMAAAWLLGKVQAVRYAIQDWVY